MKWKNQVTRSRSVSIRRILVVLAQQLFFLLAPSVISSQSAEVSISTPREIEAEFTSVPCKNEDRLAAVKLLFEKVGAPPSEVSIDSYKNVENLVIRKQGTSQDKIVIGAHYDKVAEGCGAIDNWTGIVTLAHLYKSLKDIQLNKTLLFVAFGKEEKGLVGSHSMVAAIRKDEVSHYCEMINIDSLGLAAPQVADNMSSKKLTIFIADLAKEMKVPFSHASINNAMSDSNSFLEKGIPALTIHGLTNEWPRILHGPNDKSSKINPSGVYLGYRLALALTVRLDGSPCSEYR
jgi:Zn-dependent M28 family amino/carboxypeptidase